jgi:mRNA interferase MazF
MPGFKPWDIVKVPFPYTDRPVQQRRPALVLASLPGGGAGLLWVLMITSAENRGWPGDVVIESEEDAGLPAPSIVRTSKIATIDHSGAEPLGMLPAGRSRQLVMRQVAAVLDAVQLGATTD